jgi:uncharacterized membrane protein (UPF0127 family)
LRRVKDPVALVVVVAAVAAAMVVSGCGRAPAARGDDASTRGTPRAVVVFLPEGRSEARVRVELARSEPEREHGLMDRKHLDPDAGMLFLFDVEEEQGFWMKNTLIPLDMIFVKADMTVAGVVENAEPLTLDNRTVGVPSQYVVEVNGGWAHTHGVSEGTPVRFEGVQP